MLIQNIYDAFAYIFYGSWFLQILSQAQYTH